MNPEIRAGVLHASGRPFSAYSFGPAKEYVAVGGRNPRVLQLIFEFFFDSLYGSIVISGFI
jgi:hypothetical protein